MKCAHCGGRLEGNLTVCSFCGTRQDVDLSQVHHRDLGHAGSMPCPGCEATLNVIEFDLDPPIRIERCESCFGMFFNPGELVALLEAKTNPLVWLDRRRLEEITENYGYNHEVVYLKCPICGERMSHRNFGGRSGVVLDQCGAHGMWVEGGELRRLLEWWRAGGKHLHQQHEARKAARLHGVGGRRAGSNRARTAETDAWRKFAAERAEPAYPSLSDAVYESFTGLLSRFFD